MKSGRKKNIFKLNMKWTYFNFSFSRNPIYLCWHFCILQFLHILRRLQYCDVFAQSKNCGRTETAIAR
jgi:hypothetical protein